MSWLQKGWFLVFWDPRWYTLSTFLTAWGAALDDGQQGLLPFGLYSPLSSWLECVGELLGLSSHGEGGVTLWWLGQTAHLSSLSLKGCPEMSGQVIGKCRLKLEPLEEGERWVLVDMEFVCQVGVSGGLLCCAQPLGFQYTLQCRSLMPAGFLGIFRFSC